MYLQCFSLISSKRIWWHPFFFVLISSKSIDTIRAVFGLGFYGSFFHKPSILRKYFPPNVPISWKTNVKITNITPRFCHIVFNKFNVTNSIKRITCLKKTVKNSKNRQNFIPPYILNQCGDPHFLFYFWMCHSTYYNILKFRKNVMGEPFV